MSIPGREQLANNSQSQLNGAIDSSQTSITVVSGAAFPSVGNFRLVIQDEILICTSRSTNTLTVIRGQEGTAAASHADGTDVRHVLTAGGLTQWAQDNTEGWGHPSAPPLGVISNGSGGLLASSDFTWVNQGTSTISDQFGTMFLRAPAAAGEQNRILKRSAPSAPYSVIAAFQVFKIREGTETFGILLRESSTQKFSTFGWSLDSVGSIRFSSYNYTDHDTFAGTTLYGREDCLHVGEYFWVKVEDDNANLKFYVSYDGVEWLPLDSTGRTSFMAGGPDEVGFFVNNQGSTLYEMGARLSHWSTI